MDTKYRFILTSLAHLQTKILHVKDHLNIMYLQALCQPTHSNFQNKLASLKIL